MKTELKILATVLMLLPLTLSANEDSEFQQECQAIVYGLGSIDVTYEEVAFAIIDDVAYTTDKSERTEFYKHASRSQLLNAVCKNTLTHATEDGFHYDFMWQASKAIDKKFAML